MDRSPAEVVATLLDEEVYLCSERTMYRVLASEVPVQERRAQRTHPEYKKPELMATAPNQVWSWDITRLLGPKKWSYYYLYVIMDIYSRSFRSRIPLALKRDIRRLRPWCPDIVVALYSRHHIKS